MPLSAPPIAPWSVLVIVLSNDRMSPTPAALAVGGSRQSAITVTAAMRLPPLNFKVLNISSTRRFILLYLWLLHLILPPAEDLSPPVPSETCRLVQDMLELLAGCCAASTTMIGTRVPADRSLRSSSRLVSEPCGWC